MYPKIVATPWQQSHMLSWSYHCLLQIEASDACEWYEKEAAEQNRIIKTLQRNVSSQYDYRMLKTQVPEKVEREMKELTSPYQEKLEFIKNPVIAEFLGMQEDSSYLESDLEQCIIDSLQKFLMELGKEYTFAARQQHIHTEKEDCYIDWIIPPVIKNGSNLTHLIFKTQSFLLTIIFTVRLY